MISKITPSVHGIGRVQYLALKADIEANLIAGHTRIAIHNHYAEQGKITFSYKRFCYYVSHYSSTCMQKNQDSKPSPILSATSLPANTNSPVQLEQGQKFAHEKNLSDENIKDLT
ncbi:TraK family protein [Maridesulfovibrio frigidus]|uniref:TraK family protein n=1 Tax=Maridesulfovibrio frigidus TaxID=340956 RepID=UPI0004E179D8|nr:TraK family protein [Maridesulfovibrio frigidus]